MLKATIITVSCVAKWLIFQNSVTIISIGDKFTVYFTGPCGVSLTFKVNKSLFYSKITSLATSCEISDHKDQLSVSKKFAIYNTC